MFTGLVEEMGTVLRIDAQEDRFDLVISAEKAFQDACFGDSICVSGVCLSITEFDEHQASFGLAPETLRVTSLSELTEGAQVNLERSVLPTTRLGGHYVQGHVDGVGTIRSRTPDRDALMIVIETDADLLKYIVRKGYICVDGASLTVVDTGEDWFSLTLIRHSQALVTLGQKHPGDRVNLETDIMAKYAEKILAAGRPS